MTLKRHEGAIFHSSALFCAGIRTGLYQVPGEPELPLQGLPKAKMEIVLSKSAYFDDIMAGRVPPLPQPLQQPPQGDLSMRMRDASLGPSAAGAPQRGGLPSRAGGPTAATVPPRGGPSGAPTAAAPPY